MEHKETFKKELEEWEEQDPKAPSVSVSLRTISEEAQNLTSGTEVWAKLEDIYARDSVMQEVTSITEVYAWQYNASLSNGSSFDIPSIGRPYSH